MSAQIIKFPREPDTRLVGDGTVIDVVKTDTFKRYLELHQKYCRDPLIAYNPDF